MKHALETQAALVALARSLVSEAVEVHGGDGVIFFDSSDKAALDAAWIAFRKAYRSTAEGRRVLPYRSRGRSVWRLSEAPEIIRFGVRLELTEDERGELLAGAWYSRQKDARGGKGLKVAPVSGR